MDYNIIRRINVRKIVFIVYSVTIVFILYRNAGSSRKKTWTGGAKSSRTRRGDTTK